MSIQFNPEILKDLDLVWEPTGRTQNLIEGYTTLPLLAARTPQLRVDLPDFEGFESVSWQLEPGFWLVSGSKILPFESLAWEAADFPALVQARDAQGGVWFILSHGHQHTPDNQTLLINNTDVLVGPALANWLGQPTLAGSMIGVAELLLQGLAPFSLAGLCTPNLSGVIDVRLVTINGLTQLQRSGGRLALSFSATLDNVGVATVPWHAAIAPDGSTSGIYGQHPFLILNLYRLKDGQLDMIGRSDVKHAFFSTNVGCGCQGDNWLYPGCGDTYSSGNNSSQFFFGPRNEVNPKTGAWSSLGSHFDAIPVNDFRDHGNETGAHGPFDHRLTAMEADLSDPGATYWMEAWYLVQDDINILNSMGYRQVFPSFNGTNWTFSQAGTFVRGPVVETWIDPNNPGLENAHARVQDPDGEFRLVVHSEDLGDGFTRYTYGLMNLDHASGLTELRLPFDPSSSFRTAFFHDADQSADNDWSVSLQGSELVFAPMDNNPQIWGSLLTMGFEANAPPTAGYVIVVSPASGNLNVASLIPFCDSQIYLDLRELWPLNTTILDLITGSCFL
ncbi:MAG: hypothetical protein H6510_01970 [Acidobacteria bacterium]|nr:hypothetical protein [Acidobacteriota bacterium]